MNIQAKLKQSLWAVTLGLSACAPQPENVAAVSQSSAEFAGLSCSKLAVKKVELTQQIATLSASQKKAATSDTVGVLLLGLPLASMSGTDVETSLAVAKGRLDALDLTIAKKGCR